VNTTDTGITTTDSGEDRADQHLEDAPLDTDTPDEPADDRRPRAQPPAKRLSWTQLVGFVVLPLLAVLLAAGAGYLKYQEASAQSADRAREQSVQAATDAAVAMLSYTPSTAEATLGAARDRLTGPFKDSYTSLTHDVVIPGATQRDVSATATVPAAASETATDRHAVVLVFVNQTIVVGNDAPSATASAVEVTLERIDNRWLISGFDPK